MMIGENVEKSGVEEGQRDRHVYFDYYSIPCLLLSIIIGMP